MAGSRSQSSGFISTTSTVKAKGAVESVLAMTCWSDGTNTLKFELYNGTDTSGTMIARVNVPAANVESHEWVSQKQGQRGGGIEASQGLHLVITGTNSGFAGGALLEFES